MATHWIFKDLPPSKPIKKFTCRIKYETDVYATSEENAKEAFIRSISPIDVEIIKVKTLIL